MRLIFVISVSGERLSVWSCPSEPHHEAGRPHDVDPAPAEHRQPELLPASQTDHPDLIR